MRKIACERCPIRDASCIVDLPPDKLEEFSASSATGIHKPRQVIFHEGTPAAGLYILCQGAVELLPIRPLGSGSHLAVAAPGEVLGELPFDESEPYATSAEALTEVQLCYLRGLACSSSSSCTRRSACA